MLAKGKKQGRRPPPIPARGKQYKQAAAMLRQQPRPKRQRKQRKSRARGYGSETIERQSLGRASGRALQGGVGMKKTDRIIEREFVGNIAGSTGFAIANTIALNPGLVASFPWLSIEAAGWESYRFNRLRFCYYTRKGSSTDGSVIMGPDYDPADPAPPDEATFVTYQDVKEFAPWMDEVCVDLDSSQLNKIGKYKYVRGGSLPTNQVLADVDSGNFFIATTGMADTSNVGKLWVEYDVTFQTKQRSSATAAPTNTKVAQFYDTAPVVLTTGVAKILPMPTVQANGVSAVNTAGSIVLPAGNYLIDASDLVSAATNMTSHSFVVLKNAAIQENGGLRAVAAAAVMTVDCQSLTCFVSSNGTDVFQCSVTVIGTGALGCQATIRIVAI